MGGTAGWCESLCPAEQGSYNFSYPSIPGSLGCSASPPSQCDWRASAAHAGLAVTHLAVQKPVRVR